MGQARDQPGAHRIGDSCHHDRDRRRCAFRGEARIGPDRHNDVDLLLNQFHCERSEPIAPPGCIPLHEVDVLAFPPAQLT